MKTPIVTTLQSESTIDFSSYITTLIFTSGCNFRCSYCHNYKLWEKREDTLTYKELSAILKAAKENWVEAICITGGEPTIHKDLFKVINFIKKKGFKIKLDTNGSNPERIKELLNLVDYFAMDYKASLSNYKKIIRTNIDLNKIKESRDLIINKAKDYEFRTTIIPGIHKEDEIKKMCLELTGAKRIIFQPFVPKEELLDNDYIRVKRTQKNLLDKAIRISKSILKNCEIRSR